MIELLILGVPALIGVGMFVLYAWLKRRQEKPYSDKEQLWNRVGAIEFVREHLGI